MNIFYLDPSPRRSAEQICIVHQNKMLVESCQLLSTALHVLDGDDVPNNIYACSHVNHPCAVWVRQSLSNYMWLFNYAEALADLYRERTGKWHKCEDVIAELQHGPDNIRVTGKVDPLPECVDADIKRLGISTVQKYRKQLNRKYEEWITRDKPIAVQAFPSRPEWWSVG